MQQLVLNGQKAKDFQKRQDLIAFLEKYHQSQMTRLKDQAQFGEIPDKEAQVTLESNKGDAATLVDVASSENVRIKKSYVGEVLSYNGQGVLIMGAVQAGKSALSNFLLKNRSKDSTGWKFLTLAAVLSVLEDGRLIGENGYDLPLISRSDSNTLIYSELPRAEIKFVVLIGDVEIERERFSKTFGVSFEEMGVKVIIVDPQKFKNKGPAEYEPAAAEIKYSIEQKVNQYQNGNGVSAFIRGMIGKEKVSSSGMIKADSASLADTKGGIDLNPVGMDLQTGGDAFKYNLPQDKGGAGMPVPNVNIQGLYPVIINIMPIADYLPMIGVRETFPSSQDLVLYQPVT